jgi:hypothetical protein
MTIKAESLKVFEHESASIHEQCLLVLNKNAMFQKVARLQLQIALMQGAYPSDAFLYNRDSVLEDGIYPASKEEWVAAIVNEHLENLGMVGDVQLGIVGK